jgi:hypothetical protein
VRTIDRNQSSFAQWVRENPQIKFHDSVAGVEHSQKKDRKRLAIISGRTSDNPRLLREAISVGCSHIYLEKPGQIYDLYSKPAACFCFELYL